MFQRSIFKDGDVEVLGKKVLKVLERVGIICQNEEMLKALEDKGAKVDYSHETAVFPPKMVEEFVEIFRKESKDKDSNNGHREFVASPLSSLSTEIAQFFYDYERKEKRSGNKRDFVYLAKLGDSLHPEEGVGHSLTLTDVNYGIEPLEVAVLLAEYAHKPNPPFVWEVNQVDYLMEMGEILGIKNWFNWGAVCFAHPFRFDKPVADKFVRRVKEGYSTGLVSMTVAGATAPVTVEGYVTVAAAEHIATWITERAINPEIELSGCMFGGSTDMRTGATSYSSFDAMFYGFATVEFLRRWCGVNIYVQSGEYCDAKLPGLYAALEKAYKAMTVAAFQGVTSVIGWGGHIDEGKTVCPVQLILDRELGKGLWCLSRKIDPSEENIAMDTILDVGFGLKKNYLETEHTLRHFCSSLWCPQIWDRSGWNGFENEEKILKKAQEKVNSLIAEYRKPEVDPDKILKMRQVIEKARKNLLK